MASSFKTNMAAKLGTVGVYVYHYDKFLPAHASEQGNVIGLVSVYIYSCHQKKIVMN